MKKNVLFNTVMLLLIVLMAAGGIMFVGNTKGWFGKDDHYSVIAEKVMGSVEVQRSGVAYTLEEKAALREGDIIEAKENAKAIIAAGNDTFTINGGSAICVTKSDETGFAFSVNKGDIFAVINDGEVFENAVIGTHALAADRAVWFVSVQTGSYVVNVLEGDITLKGEMIRSANTVSASDTFFDISELSASSLSDFAIKESLAVTGTVLCFTNDDLQNVLDAREGERLIAVTDSLPDDTDNSETLISCTIQIRCDAILDNLQKLETGKEVFVPSDGMILTSKTFEVEEGTTAFDVLKDACSAYSIPLEFSWTPGYNSNYVEGINHLYEFDCGETSGWKYKVNGWYPNYGSSQYEIEDGDVIVWTYTCEL